MCEKRRERHDRHVSGAQRPASRAPTEARRPLPCLPRTASKSAAKNPAAVTGLPRAPPSLPRSPPVRRGANLMATQLATRSNDPIAVVRQNLTQMAPQFEAALPKHISVEKFTRVALTAIQNNPDLAVKADRRSLFGACVRLAQDGLLPDGREGAIVMFGDKAQAMPMIAGVLKKIRQSGEVAKVSAQVVYEKDEFVWHLGFDEDVTHNPPPLDQPRGKPIGAYATAVLKDGSRLLEVMSLEEIEKVRAVSRAKGNGPWVQWWGGRARKTVMRPLSKRRPLSTALGADLGRE